MNDINYEYYWIQKNQYIYYVILFKKKLISNLVILIIYIQSIKYLIFIFENIQYKIVNDILKMIIKNLFKKNEIY